MVYKYTYIKLDKNLPLNVQYQSFPKILIMTFILMTYKWGESKIKGAMCNIFEQITEQFVGHVEVKLVQRTVYRG